MTISMFQCLLIGLWTAFCLAGMLFGIYTNRCLVMAAGVGLRMRKSGFYLSE